MGVAMYVQGYVKEPSCIVGELSRLGWYEVDLAKVQKLDAWTVLHGSPSIFEVAISNYNWYDYGFECRAELSFYDNIYDASNTTLDHEYCIMFEPKIVLSAVTKLLDKFEIYSDATGLNASTEEHKIEIVRMKETLELITTDEGMVEISNG